MAMEYLPGKEGSVDLIADNGKILYMAYRESNVNLASIPQEATLIKNDKACQIIKSSVKYNLCSYVDYKHGVSRHVAV